MAHHKSQLPEKTCAVCGRPFVWRRKWADCWDQVKYCSERCRRQRARSPEADNDQREPPSHTHNNPRQERSDK